MARTLLSSYPSRHFTTFDNHSTTIPRSVNYTTKYPAFVNATYKQTVTTRTEPRNSMYSKHKILSMLSCFFFFSLEAAFAAGPAGVTDAAIWYRADSVVMTAGNVSVWQDLSGNGRDASQSDSNLQPAYVGSALNGQPSLRFDRSKLSFDGSSMVGTDYTIFVVNARGGLAGRLANFYLAGDTWVADQNLILGYEEINLIRQSHFGKLPYWDNDAIVESIPVPALDVFRFDQTRGRDVYRYGLPVASDLQITPVSSWSGANIGSYPLPGNTGGAFWYLGDLSEIIMYDRALTDCERSAVEAYLADRYALDHSPELDCDADGDGVADGADLCDGTTIDPLPSRNRWGLAANGTFVTEGKNPTGRAYTIEMTSGCSCAQIVDVCGYGRGHLRHGCSNSVMDTWVAEDSASAGECKLD